MDFEIKEVNNVMCELKNKEVTMRYKYNEELEKKFVNSHACIFADECDCANKEDCLIVDYEKWIYNKAKTV